MIRTILIQRLHMRNEQFGYPLSDARLKAIQAGDIKPMSFDYSGLE